MQFNHRFREVAVKVQASEAVVQAAEARRAETLESHISLTRKAIGAHNMSISYNFSRSTTFMNGLRPSGHYFMDPSVQRTRLVLIGQGFHYFN